jgi:hypothetical protein
MIKLEADNNPFKKVDSEDQRTPPPIDDLFRVVTQLIRSKNSHVNDC